jgi:hypothetical protein
MFENFSRRGLLKLGAMAAANVGMGRSFGHVLVTCPRKTQPVET